MDWRIDEILAGVPINGKAVIYFDMLVWRCLLFTGGVVQ